MSRATRRRDAAALGATFFSTVLFAVLFSKRAPASSTTPAPWQPPASSALPPPPTVPSVPTEQPKPRATPKTYKVQGLHRYEIVADLLPVDGVSIREAATKVLDSFRLDGAELKAVEPLERAGVGKVTRVTFTANSLINNEVPLDRQLSVAGVGSVWVVSIKDLT